MTVSHVALLTSVFENCGDVHLNGLLHNNPVFEWLRVKHVGRVNQWSASCMLKDINVFFFSFYFLKLFEYLK